MPSCNLAESVHNKWLQQLSKRGNDLYIVAVDDMVRAFMQVVAYYQFLKGEKPGTGPGKEELRLRAAQHTAQHSGNSKVLHDALANMRGADVFCTRDPHLEGEEVFVSLKRKADLPPGSEFDSYRPDKISVSRPKHKALQLNPQIVALTAEDPLSESECRPREGTPPLPKSPLTHSPAKHVKSVQETVCDERQWHIARLPKTSAKACFAQQAITKKKCVAKIVQDNRSTAAPTYTRLMDNYKKARAEKMQFFFCNDDINRCVNSTRRKWILSKPIVPNVWPIKMGTNLTRKEILALENTGFNLMERVQLSPRKLFGEGSSMNLGNYPPPSSPSDHPTKRYGKNIRRNTTAPTTKHHNNCASALSIVGEICSILMVPPPSLGCIVTLESRNISKASRYLLTIGQFPSCDCPSFKDMSQKSLGKRGAWTYCKHLYYIFINVCGLDPEVNIFMHAPSFS